MERPLKKLTIPILLFCCLFIWHASAFASLENLVVEETSITRFEGSWFQIGRQIGNTYPEFILEFGDIMSMVMFFAGPGGDWSPQVYYETIEDIIPQSIKDHMAGLAVGITEVLPISYQTAWDAVVAQNVATEMLNMKKNMATIPEPDAVEIKGCTGFVVTSDDGTFMGHNTDATATSENIVVLMFWQPDNDDYAYMTMDPPGWADVNYALNEKGIAITLNAGGHHTNAEIGMPANFMVRYVMEHAATLDEAVSLFQDYQDQGGNFGIAGALIHIVDFNDSTMAKLQVMSNDLDITYGEESPHGITYVGSTNHFVGDIVTDPDYYYETSIKRWERLQQLMNQTEVFDLDACWNILKDTDGGEATNNTISRLGDTGSATIFGTVFTADGFYYTMGPPHGYLEQYDEPKYISFDEISTLEPRSFIATPKAFHIILKWNVYDAERIKGYNIWCAKSQNGGYQKINSALITTTQYTDKWLPNNKKCYYKLEIVFNDNTKTIRGIVNSTPKLKYWF